MKVTTVTAAIKYSLDTGNGWKAIELGAEGTIGINDNWQQAQHQLYGELSQQLKALWCGKGTESTTQPTAEAEPPEPYCQEHGVVLKQYSKGDSFWYAHKAGGAWCNEGK